MRHPLKERNLGAWPRVERRHGFFAQRQNLIGKVDMEHQRKRMRQFYGGAEDAVGGRCPFGNSNF